MFTMPTEPPTLAKQRGRSAHRAGGHSCRFAGPRAHFRNLKFATELSDTVCEMTPSAFNVSPIPKYSEASLPEDTSDWLSATE